MTQDAFRLMFISWHYVEVKWCYFWCTTL